MTDAQDDLSFIPSTLDTNRLEDLAVDGRMTSENGIWSVLRYPPMPHKGPRWNEYTMVVAHPMLQGMFEAKTQAQVLDSLNRMEADRLRRQKRGK